MSSTQPPGVGVFGVPVFTGGRGQSVVAELVLGAVEVGVGVGIARDLPPYPALTVGAVCAVLFGTLTLVLAIVESRIPHYPVLEAGAWGGVPGVGVRAWPAHWWLLQLVDCGLSLVAVFLFVLDWTTGRWWWPGSLLLWAVPLWSFPRVWFAWSGRRMREGLGVAAGDLIHEAEWGAQSVPLAAIDSVIASRRTLALVLRQPARRSPCPPPWCGRMPRSRSGMIIDTGEFGHRAVDLANWVASQVPHPLERHPDLDGVWISAPTTTEKDR